MISLIMGLPGVGKGTQAELICDEYNIAHLSTGNIFRNTMKGNSVLSKELASYINRGELVPDDLTIKMLKEEISQEKYQSGFLLDGFPRTVEQAKHLNTLLSDMNMKIDNIIFIKLTTEEIMKRLSGRLTCPNCQATYNKYFSQPVEIGICDKCQHQLITREDDNTQSIKKRLSVAKEQTLPVIDYYKEIGKVIEVEALNKSIDKVFSEIKNMVIDQ